MLSAIVHVINLMLFVAIVLMCFKGLRLLNTYMNRTIRNARR